MLVGAKIFAGGMAVILLFVGQIWLLGLLNDRLDANAKAEEAATPGLANYKAKRLVRWLGMSILSGIKALAWLSGLAVLPAFGMIVYEGAWAILPFVVALTFGFSFVERWASRNLEALASNPSDCHCY